MLAKDIPLHPLLIQRREEQKAERALTRKQKIINSMKKIRTAQASSDFLRTIVNEKVLRMSAVERLEWMQERDEGLMTALAEVSLSNSSSATSLDSAASRGRERAVSARFSVVSTRGVIIDIDKAAQASSRFNSKKAFEVRAAVA